MIALVVVLMLVAIASTLLAYELGQRAMVRKIVDGLGDDPSVTKIDAGVDLRNGPYPCARVDTATGLICTLLAMHDGPHVAEGSRKGKVLATWHA